MRPKFLCPLSIGVTGIYGWTCNIVKDSLLDAWVPTPSLSSEMVVSRNPDNVGSIRVDKEVRIVGAGLVAWPHEAWVHLVIAGTGTATEHRTVGYFRSKARLDIDFVRPGLPYNAIANCYIAV